jgi:hypothetical protein
MPRPLAEYSLADWRRLRPLNHRFKTLRYRLVNLAHMHRPARGGDVGTLARSIRGKKPLVTIAFAYPQAIEWQARLMRAYVPQAVHLIADNSRDDASAAEIASLAERYGLGYVRLPANPWERGSRSHGIAMNWVWHNIIRPGEPDAFGFLDHDLFPTAPDDPFAALATQDFFGLVRTAGPRWFLWAGFCMFKFDRVRHQPLDFGQDWFAGLDTGGGNWEVLYRHADRGKLREASSRLFPFKPGLKVEDGPLQWCGTWLHEVGHTGRADLVPEKREALGRLLARYIAAAPDRSDPGGSARASSSDHSA